MRALSKPIICLNRFITKSSFLNFYGARPNRNGFGWIQLAFRCRQLGPIKTLATLSRIPKTHWAPRVGVPSVSQNYKRRSGDKLNYKEKPIICLHRFITIIFTQGEIAETPKRPIPALKQAAPSVEIVTWESFQRQLIGKVDTRPTNSTSTPIYSKLALFPPPPSPKPSPATRDSSIIVVDDSSYEPTYQGSWKTTPNKHHAKR